MPLNTATPPTAAEIETAVTAFVAKCQGLLDGYMKEHFPTLNPPKLTVDPKGKVYWRIVKDEGSSRSVYCFVEKATGDILKSESWKRPAKGIRGNILAGNAMDAVTPYGAVYFR